MSAQLLYEIIVREMIITKGLKRDYPAVGGAAFNNKFLRLGFPAYVLSGQAGQVLTRGKENL